MSQTSNLWGLLARYENPNAVFKACEQVRDAGYSQWDACTPFPVHGLEKAMGLKPSRLPWVVLICGVLGSTFMLLVPDVDQRQCLPLHRRWEAALLAAGVCSRLVRNRGLSVSGSLFGKWVLNGLPRPHHPHLTSKAFERVTDDKFFIMVEAAESEVRPREDEGPVAGRWGHPRRGKWRADMRSTSLTCFLFGGLMLAGCRGGDSEKPPVHLIHDVDTQEKGRPYRKDDTGLFADGRVMRAPVEGTIALGQLDEDAVTFEGLDEQGQPTLKYPTTVTVNDAVRARGKLRFGIYCAPCHGESGYGKGVIAAKALDGGPRLEVAPPSFFDQRLKDLR